MNDTHLASEFVEKLLHIRGGEPALQWRRPELNAGLNSGRSWPRSFGSVAVRQTDPVNSRGMQVHAACDAEIAAGASVNEDLAAMHFRPFDTQGDAAGTLAPLANAQERIVRPTFTHYDLWG
jgi:hypothetical protein